jgi:hypothetical protein
MTFERIEQDHQHQDEEDKSQRANYQSKASIRVPMPP